MSNYNKFYNQNSKRGIKRPAKASWQTPRPYKQYAYSNNNDFYIDHLDNTLYYNFEVPVLQDYYNNRQYGCIGEQNTEGYSNSYFYGQCNSYRNYSYVDRQWLRNRNRQNITLLKPLTNINGKRNEITQPVVHKSTAQLKQNQNTKIYNFNGPKKDFVSKACNSSSKSTTIIETLNNNKDGGAINNVTENVINHNLSKQVLTNDIFKKQLSNNHVEVINGHSSHVIHTVTHEVIEKKNLNMESVRDDKVPSTLSKSPVTGTNITNAESKSNGKPKQLENMINEKGNDLVSTSDITTNYCNMTDTIHPYIIPEKKSTSLDLNNKSCLKSNFKIIESEKDFAESLCKKSYNRKMSEKYVDSSDLICEKTIQMPSRHVENCEKINDHNIPYKMKTGEVLELKTSTNIEEQNYNQNDKSNLLKKPGLETEYAESKKLLVNSSYEATLNIKETTKYPIEIYNVKKENISDLELKQTKSISSKKASRISVVNAEAKHHKGKNQTENGVSIKTVLSPPKSSLTVESNTIMQARNDCSSLNNCLVDDIIKSNKNETISKSRLFDDNLLENNKLHDDANPELPTHLIKTSIKENKQGEPQNINKSCDQKELMKIVINNACNDELSVCNNRNTHKVLYDGSSKENITYALTMPQNKSYNKELTDLKKIINDMNNPQKKKHYTLPTSNSNKSKSEKKIRKNKIHPSKIIATSEFNPKVCKNLANRSGIQNHNNVLQTEESPTNIVNRIKSAVDVIFKEIKKYKPVDKDILLALNEGLIEKSMKNTIMERLINLLGDRVGTVPEIITCYRLHYPLTSDANLLTVKCKEFVRGVSNVTQSDERKRYLEDNVREMLNIKVMETFGKLQKDHKLGTNKLLDSQESNKKNSKFSSSMPQCKLDEIVTEEMRDLDAKKELYDNIIERCIEKYFYSKLYKLKEKILNFLQEDKDYIIIKEAILKKVQDKMTKMKNKYESQMIANSSGYMCSLNTNNACKPNEYTTDHSNDHKSEKYITETSIKNLNTGNNCKNVDKNILNKIHTTNAITAKNDYNRASMKLTLLEKTDSSNKTFILSNTEKLNPSGSENNDPLCHDIVMDNADVLSNSSGKTLKLNINEESGHDISLDSISSRETFLINCTDQLTKSTSLDSINSEDTFIFDRSKIVSRSGSQESITSSNDSFSFENFRLSNAVLLDNIISSDSFKLQDTSRIDLKTKHDICMHDENADKKSAFSFSASLVTVKNETDLPKLISSNGTDNIIDLNKSSADEVIFVENPPNEIIDLDNIIDPDRSKDIPAVKSELMTDHTLKVEEIRGNETNAQLRQLTVDNDKKILQNVENSEYVVKILTEPDMPQKHLMKTFLQKFEPIYRRKHISVGNVFIIGLKDKTRFNNILAADGTMLGDSKLVIKAVTFAKQNAIKNEFISQRK